MIRPSAYIVLASMGFSSGLNPTQANWDSYCLWFGPNVWDKVASPQRQRLRLLVHRLRAELGRNCTNHHDLEDQVLAHLSAEERLELKGVILDT